MMDIEFKFTWLHGYAPAVIGWQALMRNKPPSSAVASWTAITNSGGHDLSSSFTPWACNTPPPQLAWSSGPMTTIALAPLAVVGRVCFLPQPIYKERLLLRQS